MLTVTSLLLRTAGVFFSARLSIIAGKAVMGLYTQIMTVYAFAVTAASAGINLGATRIVSECYGSGELGKIHHALKACLRYCLISGITVGALLFFAAPMLGGIVLRDGRTVISFRALAFALPFIALSNALHGYFNGVKEIPKSAFTSLFEQFARIFATITALTAFSDASTEMLCFILVVCNASSEALSFFILSVFYKLSNKRFSPDAHCDSSLKRRFTGITLPIAASSLIRSALTTTEHILIPIGLRKSGLSGEGALGEYGIMSGMVLPILLYPMALLTSFASLTVAELSARVSAGEGRETLRNTAAKGLTFALIYGIGCTAIVRRFASELGNAIYKSDEAGRFIALMAPLIIFMYLDHIADGMLKGLDKQNYVMKVNILDAALSVVFALVLIPRFGIYGFAASLYLCEILNCIFSFSKLFMLLHPPITLIYTFIIPTASAFIAVYAVSYTVSQSVVFNIISAVMIYFALLKATGALKIFGGSANSVMQAQTQNKASAHH